jgi:hypothetical protein
LEGASADFQITQTYLEYLGDSHEKRQAEPLSSRLERISPPERAVYPTRRRKHSELSFSKSELDGYVVWKKERLAPKSKDWINRASQVLWDCTHGDVSEETMTVADFYPRQIFFGIFTPEGSRVCCCVS